MRILDIISEAKKQEAPKPRNFVAKNAINTGAGAHKDKKKAEKQGNVKHKKQAIPMDEAYGRRSSYYNPMDYERDQQRQMDWEKRDFKRREMEHELGDEEEYYRQQVAKERERDRGPWYLKINGKILKSQGQPKVFDWKKGANNYALAIIKNKPELQGKIFLTKRAEDDAPASIAETATAGATSAGNIGTVVSPHLAIGKDRGKKSYTGSPGKSGTKAPAVPKAIQKKNPDGTAKNALDMPNNIFGGGAVKR